MKGIASLFFIVAIFLNCHINSFSQTQRNPVLEFCTGNWCPWCPCGHIVVEQIKSSFPNAIFLGYHGPANGSDPFSYFSGNSIISSFGFSGYPTGTIDRVSGIQSRGSWYGLMSTRNSMPATVSIDLDAAFNPITRGFTATINLSALTNLSGQYKLNVVLLEDGIQWYQNGNGSCPGSSHYIHNNVVRDMMNGALGEEIVNGNWNESEVITKTVNRTISLPGGTGPDMIWDNCSIVILVYKVSPPLASNSEIQQAKIYSLINLSVLVGVNSPQGGESFPIGSTQEINWTSNNVEDVKIEYTTDGGISWITIVDSIQNSGSYDWTIPNTISDNCKIKISDVANSSVYDESDGSFTIFLAESNVNEGWNIVSVPLQQLDMSVSSLFPNAISAAYGYDGGYNETDTLMNAIGYWIKFDSTEVIPFVGDQVDSNIIAVNNGWNMIGPYAFDISVYSITTIPPDIIDSPFYGFDLGYVATNTLKIGRGYWVKTNASGILQFNIVMK